MALVLNGSDTSAGDDAGLGYTAAEGLILTGQGTTSDVTIKNDADQTVLSIPTGTTNVGIGTTSPATELEIYNAGFTAAQITSNSSSETQLRFATNTAGRISNQANTALIFDTNATERVRISNDGKVGIGTTSPASTLDVLLAGNGNISGPTSGVWAARVVNEQDSDTYNGLAVQNRWAADSAFILEGAMGWNGSSTGYFPVFTIDGLGQAIFKPQRSEAMRITSDGKVGIGTTAPDSLVEISSGGATTAKVSTTVSNSYAEIIFEDGNAGYGFQVRSDGAQSIATGSMVINDRDTGSFPVVINEGCATNTLKLSGGNVSVGGALSKGSGSFKIDHPLESKKDTHYLAHSFVEGAQADNIYRGKINLVNGTATVNVDTVSNMTDGTFVALNRDIQCFTTNETGWTAVKGSVSGNLLTINAQDNTCTDTISWLVIGERQDPHMYEVDWTDEHGKVITEPLKEE